MLDGCRAMWCIGARHCHASRSVCRFSFAHLSEILYFSLLPTFRWFFFPFFLGVHVFASSDCLRAEGTKPKSTDAHTHTQRIERNEKGTWRIEGGMESRAAELPSQPASSGAQVEMEKKSWLTTREREMERQCPARTVWTAVTVTVAISVYYCCCCCCCPLLFRLPIPNIIYITSEAAIIISYRQHTLHFNTSSLAMLVFLIG